ncbi:MAG: universal stress protein [Sandaracinaceae bacterium]|jgi:universal stress protein A|nr:universal stress protein [Sandaracinaceae bacterium]
MTTKKILFATDFSEGAAVAEAKAVELALALGAELHLLHSWSIPIVPSGFGVADVSVDITNAVQNASEELMKRELEKLKATGLKVQGTVKLAEPWSCIVETAKAIDASMIVMGTHGRRGLPRVLLGSVAEKVVRTAGCPVLTVSSHDRANASVTAA